MYPTETRQENTLFNAKSVKISPESLESVIERMRAAGEYLLDEVALLDVAYAEMFGGVEG